MMLSLVSKADAKLKQNISFWSVNSFDFTLEKLHKITRMDRSTKHALLNEMQVAPVITTKRYATFVAIE